MRFWELYRIVFKRKAMIVGLIASTLSAIWLATLHERPYYVARVEIMPSDTALYRPMMASPVQNPNNILGERQQISQLPNIMSLIKSRPLAERTVRAAAVDKDPQALLESIEVGTVSNPGARSHDEIGTDIIEVRVKDASPVRAVHLVNSLAHEFTTYYQEFTHQEASGNRLFLESQFAKSRRELDDATRRLSAFKRKNGVSDASTTPNPELARYQQASADRDAASAALSETQAQLTRVNRELEKMGPTRRVSEGTSNTPMVQQLETQLADLTRQLNDARAKYQDTHPQVIALKDSIAEVEKKLKQEQGKMSRTVSDIRNPVYESLLDEKSKLEYERDGLVAKVARLGANAGRVRGDLKPGMDIALARLENEFTTSQTAYNNLQAQLNQAHLNEKETTATGAMRIVEEASEANGPIGVRRRAYLMLGALLSIVVGVGMAITMESLDNRLRTTDDLERLMGLPATALIPSSGIPQDSRLARLTYTEPLNPISEAYRFLRTDLLLSTQGTGIKTIMVATAKPGQGGTVTVANLGISLAMDGKRVVLVDADMRRPCLHRVFKVDNEWGLSNILSNEKDFGDCMFQTEVDNLLLIPGGPTPSNPSELVGSARMRALIDWLSEQADYVLIDTPSAVAFTDAVVMSQIADGVLLVVRAQQVPRGAELQVRHLLNKANANILGIVLNDVQPETVDSYYYHSHYYPEMWSNKSRKQFGRNVLPPKGSG